MVLLTVLTLLVAVQATASAGLFDAFKKDEVVKLTTKDICPMMATFSGSDLDPYKDKPLEYKKIHIQQVDDFTVQVVKIKGTLNIAKNIAEATSKEIDAGPLDTKLINDRIGMVVGVLAELPLQVTGAITAGQNLVTNIANIVVGPNIGKIKSITESIKANIEDLKTIPAVVTDLTKSLTEMSKKLADAEALAKAAAEATDKATEAGDDAKEAAEGAVDQAAGAVEAAKDTAADAAAAASDAAAGAAEAAGEAADAAADGAEKAGDAIEKAAE
jgi:hypothetical protein